MKKIMILAVMVLSAGAAVAGEKLSLEDSRKLALENNVAMKNSRLETEASRQVRKAAFTRYFPSVSATGLVLRADDSLVNITSPGGNLPVYDGNPATLPAATEFAYFPSSTTGLLKKMTLASVTAVQPLWTGGRIINGNRLAALGVEASQEKERLARNEVLKSTEEQYWRIVSLAEKMKTIDSAEALLRRLLTQVQDAFDAGLVMKNDVLKVKLRLSEVLLNRSKAENGRALATRTFCQYLGIAYDSGLELSDPLVVEGRPEAYHVDHKAALTGRPEYALLQDSVRAEGLKTRLVLGENLPQLAVGAGGFYMQMDLMKGRTNGIVFGTLSVPLSGWWEGSHNLAQQKAREEVARNSLQNGEDLLLLQMEKAWRDLTDADKELALCGESAAQAEENLKVNQDAYDAGLITVSDLLEAQALRQQARDQLTEAMAGFRVKLVDYLQATGR